MASKRDISRYVLKEGNKTVYIGITNEIQRREQEHAQEKQFGHIKQVGPKVTLETAKKWEEATLETYRTNHSGDNPKYNKTDKG